VIGAPPEGPFVHSACLTHLHLAEHHPSACHKELDLRHQHLLG